MGKLVFYKIPDAESLDWERHLRYASLPFEKKLYELFALIDLTIKLGGGRPLKKPVGAGLVLHKKKQHGYL